MKKLFIFMFGLLAVCLLGIAPAYAQLASANLAGTIRDDKGEPLPGVSISAKNQDTGFERSDISTEAGSYRIPSLPFGTYDVRATLQGFATQVQTDIRLDVGRTVTIDFSMKLSATGEVIQVVSEAPLVERTESHVATVVTPEQVENLPLNLRQFANLAVLAPATSLKVNNDPTRPSNLAVSLVGGSGRNVNTTIDGGDNNDDTIGGINQFFPLSAIAEFNFLTNRYKAEYGRSNGGVLNVVTKTGTNDLHGSFFAGFRDDSLNALSKTEENAGLTEPAFYSREQFGGTVGGPIVKDRAHFFVAIERYQTDQETQIDSGGIFPDLDGDTVPVPLRETLYTAKGTVNLDPRQYLTVRYGQQKTEASYNAAPNYAPSAQGQVTNTFHSFLASHNYVISNDMLNEFLFQYADFKDSIVPNSTDPTEFFPGVDFYVGQGTSLPQSTFQDKYQFKDDFSWTMRGNHHFKAGINFVHEPTLGGTFSNNVGVPNFTHLESSADSPITSIFINGPDTGEFGAPNDQYGIYFQDDWNVNEKLTLNLGVRYDYISGFDIDQSGNDLFLALKGLPFDFPWLQAFKDSADGSLQNDTNNIAPRLGFAYDWNADGMTVIRGGYGRYFDFPYTNANVLFPLIALTGFGQVYFNEDPAGIRNPDGTFFQVGDPLPPNQLAGVVAVPNDIASPDFVVPYSDQISVGVSRQLNPDSAIDVDYIHVRFRDQFLRFRANGDINGVDILPQFGNFRVWFNGGESDYDALSFTYRRRVTEGVQFHAAYTLSRAEGNTLPGSDEFRLGQTNSLGGCRDCLLDFMQDVRNDPRQRGPLDTDARHRVVIAGTVDLPADFRVSGFFRANSATPFNAFVVADLDGDGFAYSINDAHVNSRRQEPFSQLDIRLSKIFRIKDAVNVEGIFEVFNVFNAENPAKFRGDENDQARFGTPRGFAGDPDQGEQRLAQFGFRVEF